VRNQVMSSALLVLALSVGTAISNSPRERAPNRRDGDRVARVSDKSSRIGFREERNRQGIASDFQRADRFYERSSRMDDYLARFNVRVSRPV
jgi:hypothetical protein